MPSWRGCRRRAASTRCCRVAALRAGRYVSPSRYRPRTGHRAPRRHRRRRHRRWRSAPLRRADGRARPDGRGGVCRRGGSAVGVHRRRAVQAGAGGLHHRRRVGAAVEPVGEAHRRTDRGRHVLPPRRRAPRQPRRRPSRHAADGARDPHADPGAAVEGPSGAGRPRGSCGRHGAERTVRPGRTRHRRRGRDPARPARPRLARRQHRRRRPWFRSRSASRWSATPTTS